MNDMSRIEAWPVGHRPRKKRTVLARTVLLINRAPARLIQTGRQMLAGTPPRPLREVVEPLPPDPRREADLIIIRQRLAARRRRGLAVAVVLLATLMAAIYVYFLASPMYQSSAQFAVRGLQESGTGGVLGKIGQSGGALASLTDGFVVRDYLQSFDALQDLDHRIGYIDLMTVAKSDPFNRLSKDAPAESLTAFYNYMVKARYNMTEGIISLDVFAFTPKDAYLIASTLTKMANEFSARLNQKATEDTMRVAQEDVKRAEDRMSQAHVALAEWRKRNSSLDVESNAKMIQQGIGQLETQLLDARGELEQLKNNKLYNTPRRATVEDRISTLKAQIARENDRLVNAQTATSVVNQIGDYQRLLVEQEFAGKAFETASQSLLNARTLASMQSKFIVAISGPNHPQMPSWPVGWKVILVTFMLSLVAVAMASLLLTVIRDNSRT